MTPNPKIRELIVGMGIIPESEHYDIVERVVSECIEVCKSRAGNSDYNTGRMHCVSDLREHFGIECNGFCGEYECKENQANCKRLRK